MSQTVVNHFPELRKIVADHGLFQKRPIRSIVALIINVTAYFACVGALALNQSTWFILLDAFILTIISGQLGFLMHDAGHRQVFRSTRKNNIFGYIATFFTGSSFQSWMDGHNAHHESPNHEDLDPDIDVFFIAYSEKQVDESNRFMRFIAQYQAWLATVFYTFVFYFMRYGSFARLIKNHPWKVIVVDVFFTVVWHIAYFGTLFVLLGFWKMVLFVAVHHALTGLHFALVFAPNHKGMPIFENDTKLNWFTRQVVTARNIFSHPLTNFLYGGLNFQIEHHLFPTMPRVHLQKAQQITKQYCKEKQVDYHETTVVQSYREVYGALAEVALYARNLKRPVGELQTQLSLLVQRLKSDLEDLKQREIHHTQGIHDRLSTLATDCLQRLKDNQNMRKEKLLLAQKEVRELSAAIRQHISPLQL